ncbi:PaaI family thioesterase [Candidatus Binatus soli]|uniref:PaaI family thioesterase n=1 Tax=Candidatus Binatus soli TaxID=1953413 RepID=UPI003D13CA29
MADHDRSRFVRALESAPFAAMLGLKIESAADGAALVRMPFDLRLLNEGGRTAPIHGGAIASLADVAACAAVWTLAETVRTATISITVNYTGFAVNSDLTARARVKRTGKRIASLSVEIADASDALIADALVTYKIA